MNQEMKILIIEDSMSSYKLLLLGLVELQVLAENIQWVPSLESADTCLSAQKFNVIFLDLNLPGCIRNDPLLFIDRHPDQSIIVFSGSEDKDLIFHCMKSGALHFVSKNSCRLEDLERALVYVRE